MVREEFTEADPKQQIVELVTREMESLRRRMKEIKDQVDSMQSAVDKEQNRYGGIAMEIRNIKENLDTVPREDIRDKYDEALDLRFRMATMRGQLEKFQSNYEQLEQQQGILTQVLTRIQGFEALPEDEAGFSGPHNAFDIVGIIRAQEEERQRLARQMHDGPAQSLTNFILQAEICQQLFDRDPDRAAQELGNLKVNASTTFKKVRDFILDLRPMMLDDLGVAPTVRRYVEGYTEKNDIVATADISGDDRRLESYREVLIFRGIQELMGIARDYAAPSTVEVKLDIGSSNVRVVVRDDGRSFDAEAIFRNDDEVHNDARVQALRMLKGKFELVGGSISVKSTDSDGTLVRLELPVE